MSIVNPTEALSNLNTTLGRPRAAYDALLFVLQDSLPGILAAQGLPAIPTNNWLYAGQDLPPSFPILVVGGSWGLQEMGTALEMVGHAMVCIGMKPRTTRAQLQEAFDMLLCVASILWDTSLKNYIVAETDGNGPFRRTYWNPLIPGQIEESPTDYGNYVGYALHLELHQPPGGNLWR
jgi:uncharacterized membrane protein YphA (DoxX/SURF4 family)